MPKCQFCGQEVPEGQKCNCPESISGAPAPASEEQQTISLSKEQAPVQEQTPVVNDTPVNNNTVENNTPEMSDASSENAEGQVIPGVKLSKNQLVGIAAAVVAVIVLIAIISSTVTNAYKKPINKYFDGLAKAKPGSMVDSMFDEKMLEDSKTDYDDMLDNYEDLLDDLSEEFEDEYGKHVKITYKVVKKKEIKKKHLDEYEDSYKSRYDFKAHIEKGYEVKVEARIKGSEDDDKEKTEFVVLKIRDHGWKIFPGVSAGSIFD